MKFRYTRYTGEDLEGIDIEELVSKLSALLLSSGFNNPHGDLLESAGGRPLQDLHDAILEKLLSEDILSSETVSRLLGDPADADQESGQSTLEQLVQQIIEQMVHAGYIATGHGESHLPDVPGISADPSLSTSRFEVTDKSLDFLGYRALRDLLGPLGKSSVGRHDTRDLATGVEASGASKPYEFGDTVNIDASGTILKAVSRLGNLDTTNGVIDVEHQDLMVAQGEYQSSCATVLMLDCSHSMILYGEDRFTPAKQVALALANLISYQYPGDALNVVLFHDSAEEIPVKKLARTQVGPYYTNTREGLRLSRRILERQRKDMRQVIMITDGKPSALTQPNGHIYRNAFGLDPQIITETFREVANCRKAGIMINTFMLARDHELVSFVRRVAAMCSGKAYFTTPKTLGKYVLMDYMKKKTKRVH